MNKQKAGEEKRNLKYISLVITLLFFWTIFSPFVSAADPGHSAGVIAANDFESGNYSFPDSVIVNYSAFFAASGGKR